MVPEKILAVGDWDHFWIKTAWDELCSPQINHLTFWFLDISIIFYIFYFYNAKIILLYTYICWWHTFQTGFDGGSSFQTLLLQNNQQHQQLLLPSFTYPWDCLLVSPARPMDSEAFAFWAVVSMALRLHLSALNGTQQGSPSFCGSLRSDTDCNTLMSIWSRAPSGIWRSPLILLGANRCRENGWEPLEAQECFR